MLSCSPEILLVPQWPQSDASAASNVTETHPALNSMGGCFAAIQNQVQKFEKFPFCGTLLFNGFGLNAGYSLFDGDDVDDVVLLFIQPSVQIFPSQFPRSYQSALGKNVEDVFSSSLN